MSRRSAARAALLAVLVAVLAVGPAAGAEPAPTAAPAPERAAPEKVTFAEAVRRASLQSTPTLIAADEVRRAQALLGQVRASALPFLGASAGYVRLDDDRRAAPPPAPPTLARDGVSANASLQLPLVAPTRWTAWAHASEQVDVARASEADVRRSALLTTARAYLAVLAQRRFVDVSRSALQIAQARYDFAHARRAGGIGNAVDEARAEQQLATAQAQLANGELNLVRAQEALGLAAGAERPLDAAEEPAFTPGLAPDAAAAAEAARADVRAARARRDAAEHVARDSWLDWLPTLAATAQAFYNDPATVTSPRTGWQVQFVLSLPLFEGGLRLAQRRERDLLADEARLALDASLRGVRSEVRVALEEVSRAEQALGASRHAAERARTALGLVTESYRAGATNDLDVSTAQQQSRDADLQAVIAEDAVRRARLDLLAGLGQFP